MGGKKRKIDIVKLEDKKGKSVAFTKRRNGLYRKASKLCLLSPGTQIAVLVTPPSFNSHSSFYSFGHSSVDHVVSSLLHDVSPTTSCQQQDNRGKLGFWWEDERFERSENLEELKDATDAVTRMLSNVRLRLDSLKSNQSDGIHQQLEDIQIKTNENKNEETANQIPQLIEGSGSLVEIKEDDLLRLDDFFTDLRFDPFLI